jgi:ferrous iron transport protein B
MSERYTIALAGNPNSGKTTVFNRLTGGHQHVGNYPGVTVETKHGSTRHDGAVLDIVDLPGTYSLTALSAEELVARDFIITRRPDVVIDVIDASTIERQLYLAVQLLELGIPLVLAFNMADVAEHAGLKFDLALLSKLLGAAIVPTVGTTRRGIDELLDTAVSVARGEITLEPKPLSYGRDLDGEIERIMAAVSEAAAVANPRWIALKLLEGDAQVRERLEKSGGMSDGVSEALEEARQRLGQRYSEAPEILIAEARYGIISGACSETVRHTIERRHDFSDRLDTVLINPVLGIPIFLLLMYLVFTLTFRVGDPIMGWLETVFGWLGVTVSGFWPTGSERPLKSLLVDGVIGGVGGVVVFLPNILLLFLGIAFLEDSGYMARAAFIMDRAMHRIGLHGKSFIPMLIGFGCSIPAIMGTRILENRRDRLVTILVIPLMSCSARLPIYALIIPAFFPAKLYGPMLWLIYVIGILLAVLLTKLMELPPYRVPTVQGLFIHAWERSAAYLKKAGTVILAISIILWWATSYPKVREYQHDYQAELAALSAAYDKGVFELNTKLGLPEDYGGLLAALQASLEEGTKPTPIGMDPAIRADNFIASVNDIQAARDDFAEMVEDEGLEEGTVQYILVKSDLARRMDELGADDPIAFEAAMTYLDDVLLPFTEGSQLVANRMAEEELTHSVVGRMAHWLGPVLRPMGFDWRIGTALIGAFAAKEVFVAQMGIVYSVGEADESSASLRDKLQNNYTPLIGFCIMLFSLISAPCMATIAVTRAETASWKWALFQLAGLTLIAWIITAVVYQVGTAAGWGV